MPPDLLEKIASFFKDKGSGTLSEHRVLLVCMVLSLSVWFFVKMTRTYESRGVLEMNYNAPLGRVFAEEPVHSMPFKVSGTGWNLLSMGVFRRNPSLEFNLTTEAIQVISRTEISRKIEDEWRLNLMELERDEVIIRLDSLFSKKVKVELDTNISYRNGYFIRDSILLTPDSIMVYGAPQMLESIKSVRTEPLNMNCPESDFEKTLDLVNPNPGLIQFSDKHTDMFMPVEQFTEKKLTLPVMVMNARDSIRLLPTTVELICVVGVSKFSQISASDFMVVAAIDGDAPKTGGSSKAPLSIVRQPAWVRSVRISPNVVEYLVVE